MTRQVEIRVTETRTWTVAAMVPDEMGDEEVRQAVERSTAARVQILAVLGDPVRSTPLEEEEGGWNVPDVAPVLFSDLDPVDLADVLRAEAI